MARSYHVDIVRFAADANEKWVDNLLSHFTIPGVEAARQGVPRRISAHGVYCIALVRRLTRDLGVSTEKAVVLADHLLTAQHDHVTVTPAVELRINRRGFQQEIDARVAEAVESIVPARRGRPRSRPPDRAKSS